MHKMVAKSRNDQQSTENIGKQQQLRKERGGKRLKYSANSSNVMPSFGIRLQRADASENYRHELVERVRMSMVSPATLAYTTSQELLP